MEDLVLTSIKAVTKCHLRIKGRNRGRR